MTMPAPTHAHDHAPPRHPAGSDPRLVRPAVMVSGPQLLDACIAAAAWIRARWPEAGADVLAILDAAISRAEGRNP